MRMRTIEQAAAHVRELDPETALTKTALRRLIITGELPSIRVGQKYLVSLEVLETYLQSGSVTASAVGSIRPVRS